MTSKSRRGFALFVSLILFSPWLPAKTLASVDLQADLNRIAIGINKFDSNSARSTSASTISEVKSVFATNAVILSEIQTSVGQFKRNLNSVKKFIPNRDTKESPKFGTLMNLALGYEEWLNYQRDNQSIAEKCLKTAGRTFTSFSKCSIRELPRTLDNERRGRAKLQSAWNAWRIWQGKFGYG